MSDKYRDEAICLSLRRHAAKVVKCPLCKEYAIKNTHYAKDRTNDVNIRIDVIYACPKCNHRFVVAYYLDWMPKHVYPIPDNTDEFKKRGF